MTNFWRLSLCWLILGHIAVYSSEQSLPKLSDRIVWVDANEENKVSWKWPLIKKHGFDLGQSVRSISFSQKDEKIIIITEYGAFIFDKENGKQIFSLASKVKNFFIGFNEAATTYVVDVDLKELHIKTLDEHLISTISIGKKVPVSCSFAMSDSQLIVLFEDGSSVIYNVSKGKRARALPTHKINSMQNLVSSMGTKMISLGLSGQVQLYDLENKRKIGTYGDKNDPIRLANFSQDGQYFFTYSEEALNETGKLKLFECKSKSPNWECKIRDAEFKVLGATQNGKNILSAYGTMHVTRFNLDSGAVIGHSGFSASRLQCGGFSKKGRYLVTAHFTNKVYLWICPPESFMANPESLNSEKRLYLDLLYGYLTSCCEAKKSSSEPGFTNYILEQMAEPMEKSEIIKIKTAIFDSLSNEEQRYIVAINKMTKM